jgi:hypothetical protein
MNINTSLQSKQEYFTLDSMMINEDSIDNYLDDPNLSISEMIEQVKCFF